MTIYIETAGAQRELGNGSTGTMEELLSAPKIIIRRTNTNGIVFDEDSVRNLTEQNIEDIENARHLSFEDSPEEPQRVRIRRGVWGGTVGAD